MTTLFDDGIYFDLNETRYHLDSALGSTDIRRLGQSGPDYWFHSWMNPNRPPVDETTPARTRGKAMHRLVLEGKQAFESRFVRRPNDPSGATPADKSAVTKAAKRDLLGNGETLLHGDDWDRIRIAGGMIRENPELSAAFDGGVPEVSIFYTRPDGVRVKCRFDYLKPRAITDLKSITNPQGMDFVRVCRVALARGYTTQAVHYLDGRAQLARLFAEGKVFGDHDKDLLKRIAESAEYAFVWVFFQAEDAPITWGGKLSGRHTTLAGQIVTDNPIIDFERGKIEAAIARYKENLARFGTSMWVLAEPLQEVQADDLPWYGARA